MYLDGIQSVCTIIIYIIHKKDDKNLTLNDSWDSSVSIVTRQQAEQSRVLILQQQEIFLLSKEPRLAQAHLTWVPGVKLS